MPDSSSGTRRCTLHMTSADGQPAAFPAVTQWCASDQASSRLATFQQSSARIRLQSILQLLDQQLSSPTQKKKHRAAGSSCGWVASYGMCESPPAMSPSSAWQLNKHLQLTWTSSPAPRPPVQHAVQAKPDASLHTSVMIHRCITMAQVTK